MNWALLLTICMTLGTQVHLFGPQLPLSERRNEITHMTKCIQMTVSMALLLLKFVKSICETSLMCVENKIHIFEHCSYEIYKLI